MERSAVVQDCRSGESLVGVNADTNGMVHKANIGECSEATLRDRMNGFNGKSHFYFFRGVLHGTEFFVHL